MVLAARADHHRGEAAPDLRTRGEVVPDLRTRCEAARRLGTRDALAPDLRTRGAPARVLRTSDALVVRIDDARPPERWWTWRRPTTLARGTLADRPGRIYQLPQMRRGSATMAAMLSLLDGRYEDVSDRELVDAVVRGDPRAGDAFVDRYKRFINSIIFAAGLAAHDADDVFQNVFDMLWEDGCRRLQLWRGDDGFHRYLAPIVRHAIADFCSRRGRELPLAETMDPPGDEPGADDLLLEEERRLALREAARHLSPRDQAILQAVLAGQEPRVTAAALGLTKNAYYQAVFMLKERLREFLGASYPALFGGDHV